MEHLCRLVYYAVAMRLRLEDVNIHSFNNFDLRVGISCGPLVGGVIGARKPVFDIWGNTVNLASRMDSTGVMGKIQVPQDIARVILHHILLSIFAMYIKRLFNLYLYSFWNQEDIKLKKEGLLKLKEKGRWRHISY